MGSAVPAGYANAQMRTVVIDGFRSGAMPFEGDGDAQRKDVKVTPAHVAAAMRAQSAAAALDERIADGPIDVAIGDGTIEEKLQGAMEAMKGGAMDDKTADLGFATFYGLILDWGVKRVLAKVITAAKLLAYQMAITRGRMADAGNIAEKRDLNGGKDVKEHELEMVMKEADVTQRGAGAAQRTARRPLGE
ncbi:unnamed protein product, partial [Prorocentrum cordatum]